MPCHRSQPRLSGPLLGHEVPLDRLRRGLARFATKTVCGSSDALPSFSPSSLYLVFSSSSSSSSPSSSSSSCDSLESISNSWILAGFRDVGMYSFLFFYSLFFYLHAIARLILSIVDTNVSRMDEKRIERIERAACTALSKRVRHARRLPRRSFFLSIRSRHNRRICSWLRAMARLYRFERHRWPPPARCCPSRFEQVLRNSRLMRRPGVQVKRIMAFNEEESW